MQVAILNCCGKSRSKTLHLKWGCGLTWGSIQPKTIWERKFTTSFSHSELFFLYTMENRTRCAREVLISSYLEHQGIRLGEKSRFSNLCNWMRKCNEVGTSSISYLEREDSSSKLSQCSLMCDISWHFLGLAWFFLLQIIKTFWGQLAARSESKTFGPILGRDVKLVALQRVSCHTHQG